MVWRAPRTFPPFLECIYQLLCVSSSQLFVRLIFSPFQNETPPADVVDDGDGDDDYTMTTPLPTTHDDNDTTHGQRCTR